MPTAARARARSCTDEQLVARFRAGDDDAFAEIVVRHRPALRRFSAGILRAHGPEAAEDVVQEVMLRAYDRLRADSRPMALRPWLYRLTRNRSIDVLRREPHDTRLDEELVAPGSAEAHAERREHLRELVGDIRELPDRQRAALLTRELDGLSYEEIGEALGVTVPAVKSLLVRARAGLTRAAEERTADRGCRHRAGRPASPRRARRGPAARAGGRA